MKYFKLLFITAIVGFTFTSCCTQKPTKSKSMIAEHTAQSALDWSGTYKGVIPAADCEGIETTIVLGKDDTYTYFAKYLGESDTVSTIKGTFSWRQDQDPVIVLHDNPEGSRYYFMGENVLFHMGENENRITGDLADRYRLEKIDRSKIVARSWSLYELRGEQMSERALSSNPIYLHFDPLQARVSGSAGCNRMTGTYTLKGNKLSFGKVATTMMACPDMETEAKFLKMLDEVASYQLIENNTVEFADKHGNIVGKFVEKF